MCPIVSKGIYVKERNVPFCIEGEITSSTSAAGYYAVKLPFGAKLLDVKFLQTTGSAAAEGIAIDQLSNDNTTDAETIKALAVGAVTALSGACSGSPTVLFNVTTIASGTSNVAAVNAVPAAGYATVDNNVIGENDYIVYIVVDKSATTALVGRLILTFVEY